MSQINSKSVGSVFSRLTSKPILAPDPSIPYMSHRIFNPAAVEIDNKTYLYFRAIGSMSYLLKEQSVGTAYSEIPGWRSSILLAKSEDGINFNSGDKPVIEGDTWALRGVEDPRITYMVDEKRWLMTYAAFNGESVHLKIAESKDGKTWNTMTHAGQSALVGDWGFKKFGGSAAIPDLNGQLVKIEGISPSDDHWDKSAVIFPKKGKDGKYHMLFGEFEIWQASSDDGYNWEVNKNMFLSRREGQFFDNAFVEVGPPPIELEDGNYLLLYHGIDLDYVYRIGVLVVDGELNVIKRSDTPIFEPQTPVEILGWYYNLVSENISDYSSLSPEELYKLAFEKRKELGVLNPIVVFCCGAVLKTTGPGKELYIYYGAGDSVICVAKASLSEILNSIKSI